MPWWDWVADSVGSVVTIVLLLVVSLFVRRRWLSRDGGTFECSIRVLPAPADSRGWMLGLARYAGDDLEWFRIFSFAPRARETFERPMRVVGRRVPRGAEAFSLYAGHIAVEIVLGNGRRVEMAMSERALTGFLAWTEAAPPGRARLVT